MSRSVDARPLVMLVLALAVAAGCSREQARNDQSVEVGHHRVRLVFPTGWEHLDHGRQHLFRSGETQLSLMDLGPATREGLVHELREAQSLWRAGRWPDAYARVRTLGGGPTLRYASSDQRLDFWREWHNATYVPENADNVAIGAAFEALIAGTEELPAPTPASLLQYALERSIDMRRMEIASQTRRSIHGADWTEVETWDHVSHLGRLRLACVDNGGYLLVLTIERGPIEQTGPVFDALLSSIELTSETALAR